MYCSSNINFPDCERLDALQSDLNQKLIVCVTICSSYNNDRTDASTYTIQLAPVANYSTAEDNSDNRGYMKHLVGNQTPYSTRRFHKKWEFFNILK